MNGQRMNPADDSNIIDLPDQGWHFSKRLANTIEALPPLAEAVELFGQQSGWHDAIVMQVNLVLEELIVNAINNGYADGRPGHINVQIHSNAKAVTLRITDDGDAFDPFTVATPDLTLAIEDRPIGGLGIYLVRKFMDDYRYCYDKPYNQVTLSKRLALPSQE